MPSVTPHRRPLHSVLVWDTSPLLHAARADNLDILGDIARTYRGSPRRNVTTQAVQAEMNHYQQSVRGHEWLDIVHVDDLHEIDALVTWAGRVQGHKSNHGEATVLAWAEVHKATAVVDDAEARQTGLAYGLSVCGSLRIIAESVVDGHTTEYAATALVDALIATGARYPCAQGEFVPWCKSNGLL